MTTASSISRSSRRLRVVVGAKRLRQGCGRFMACQQRTSIVRSTFHVRGLRTCHSFQASGWPRIGMPECSTASPSRSMSGGSPFHETRDTKHKSKTKVLQQHTTPAARECWRYARDLVERTQTRSDLIYSVSSSYTVLICCWYCTTHTQATGDTSQGVVAASKCLLEGTSRVVSDDAFH